jgi:hypothetical protein
MPMIETIGEFWSPVWALQSSPARVADLHDIRGLRVSDGLQRWAEGGSALPPVELRAARGDTFWCIVDGNHRMAVSRMLGLPIRARYHTVGRVLHTPFGWSTSDDAAQLPELSEDDLAIRMGAPSRGQAVRFRDELLFRISRRQFLKQETFAEAARGLLNGAPPAATDGRWLSPAAAESTRSIVDNLTASAIRFARTTQAVYEGVYCGFPVSDEAKKHYAKCCTPALRDAAKALENLIRALEGAGP